MKIWFKQILLLVIGLFVAIIMPAQNLPVLQADPAIRTGVLPNGTTYYIVSNSTIKGVADFALVQKTGTANIQDTASFKAIRTAQDALNSLPRCLAPTAQSYMTAHGAVPGPGGFVKVSENATEFHFRDIILDKPSTADSTLLVLMDMIDRARTSDDPFLNKWYSPSDQAVIVSGDVNPDDVVSRLYGMSMMTPASQHHQRISYEWTPCDTASFVRVPSSSPKLGRLSATWRSPRTPAAYMGTVQPAIFEMYLAQLSIVAEENLRAVLKSMDIPVASLSCSYVLSSQTWGDETFSLNVVVSEEDFMRTVEAVSQVLACIDEGHVGMEDLLRVKRRCLDAVNELRSKPVRSNAQYVQKCSESFLYGSTLASLDTKVDFLFSREVADSVEMRLFDGIASALLDPSENLSVRYSADFDPDSVKAAFAGAWTCAGDTAVSRRYTADDIPPLQTSGAKIKLRSEKPDHMSKGKVWTFSNGFTVVYRKMKTNGMMFYNLAQNGGYSSVSDLKKGEGGYVADYLFLSRIGEMSGRDFLNVLNSEGISMEAYVGLTNMMISGYAPEDRLPLLMRSLAAVMNDRVPDDAASKYYARSESLRQELRKGTEEEGKVAIDSIMCPDYVYTPYKILNRVPDDLVVKADRYFRSQAEKMNDGLLILVGDMDEAVLKKILLSSVDGFRTTDRAFRRPQLRYQPASGWSTYTVDGNVNSVDVAMSVPMTLSSDNVVAAELAVMVLRKYLAAVLEKTDYHVAVTHACKIYPQERFNVLITLTEAPMEGFSSDVRQVTPIEALAIVRSALSDVSDMKISPSELSAMKTRLKGRLNIEMNDPFYWLNVISRRYLAGKDFTSGYEQKADAVTEARIKELLMLLNKGSKVEYVISR